MVITTAAIDPPPEGAPTRHSAYSFNRLVKPDISRHGQTGWTRTARARRHIFDRTSEKQIACRAPMRFARAYYYNSLWITPALWNDVHPVDCFCEAVKRWLAGHSPAASPYYPNNDPSALTVEATASASINSIILRFTPSDDCALWGIAIIRSKYPIVTPTWAMLRTIYPTTTKQERIWIDHPLPPGVWHYRLAACETDGKLGLFSPDIFDTVT